MLCFALFSCQTNEQVIFPAEEKKLVIESVFNTDNNFEVKVYLPKTLSETGAYEYRPNCKVEIQLPGKTINLNYNSVSKSYVSTNSQPIKGTLYKLRVEDPVYGIVTSDEIIPLSPNDISIDNIIKNIVSVDTSLSKGILYNYNLEMKIPLTNGLTPVLYNIILKEKIKQNGNIIERPVEISSVGDSSPIVQIMYHKAGILIDGNENNGSNILNLTLSCSTYENLPQDSLIAVSFDLRNVSENYYKYYNSVNLQILQANNPLESPPPLYTNIKNGYGIFAGYNTVKQSINFPKH